jgi:hypothetical protein
LALSRCSSHDPETLLDQLLEVLWADLPAAGQRDDIAMVAMRANRNLGPGAGV